MALMTMVTLNHIMTNRKLSQLKNLRYVNYCDFVCTIVTVPLNVSVRSRYHMVVSSSSSSSFFNKQVDTRNIVTV